MKKEYTCIVCPSSCRLTVSEEHGDISITGNECGRGKEHGIQEYRNPLRMLTTTVAIKTPVSYDRMHGIQQGHLPRVPVISTGEIPRAKIGECLDVLYKIKAAVPLRCGEIIVSNICNTGVDIIASCSISG